MPPKCRTTTLCVSVFFSSSAKLDLTSSFSPTNLAGVWQPSHDLPGGAQIHYWRRDRLGITIEGDFDKLLGPIHLGLEVRFGSGADVALYAGYVGVRGNFVRGVLGMHHVAGRSAELGRIHIGRSAITGRGDHQQIHDRSDKDDVESVTEHPIVEIDLGILSWNLTGELQLLATREQADRNKHQPKDKQRGQD